MSDDRLHALKNALYHDSAMTRRNAVMQIAEVGTLEAVPPLVDTLADPAPDVRAAAAEALATLALTHPVDVLPLTKLLADSSDRVREAATHALIAIGVGAVDELLHVLADDSNSTVRGAAADVLGEIGDDRTIDPLKAAYSGDPSNWVRSRARLALAKFGLSLPESTVQNPGRAVPIRTERILRAGGAINPPEDPIDLIRKQTTVQWPSLNDRPPVGEGSMLDQARAVYEPPQPPPAPQPSTPAGPTAADIRTMLDQLDVRLATGEITEATYERLVARWEARLREMENDEA